MKIYSPELVTAGRNNLLALRSREKILAAGGQAIRRHQRCREMMVAAARKRLELSTFPRSRSSASSAPAKWRRRCTIYSPVSGWWRRINIAAGHKIMQGESLLVMADYSVVWANADVYEPDLPFVKIGMPVKLTVPYYPDKAFRGNVSFISPTLDPETRTVQVRMNIPQPESVAETGNVRRRAVVVRTRRRLAVPENAVMFSGDRVYAFRDGGDGKLSPVLLKLGVHDGGYYEVLSGLKEGDRVVTSANFLVDSESSMKAAIEALAGNSA